MNLSGPNGKRVRIAAQHWHYALLFLLILVNLVLAVRLVLAWDRSKAGDTARVEERRSEYRAMQLKTKPLRGLEKKIQQARLDQQAFYGKRFPNTDSEVLKELGALAVKNHVLLARGQYAHGKPNQGLVELQMDASLSGEYAPIVRFINGLERDHVFFLIRDIALNGQQGGVVSLRMRLTTYLRTDAANANAYSMTAGSNSTEQQ